MCPVDCRACSQILYACNEQDDCKELSVIGNASDESGKRRCCYNCFKSHKVIEYPLVVHLDKQRPLHRFFTRINAATSWFPSIASLVAACKCSIRSIRSPSASNRSLSTFQLKHETLIDMLSLADSPLPLIITLQNYPCTSIRSRCEYLVGLPLSILGTVTIS